MDVNGVQTCAIPIFLVFVLQNCVLSGITFFNYFLIFFSRPEEGFSEPKPQRPLQGKLYSMLLPKAVEKSAPLTDKRDAGFLCAEDYVYLKQRLLRNCPVENPFGHRLISRNILI